MTEVESREEFEKNIATLVAKERDTIFSAPHFTDLEEAFDVMETNYFRLKQRSSHNHENLNKTQVDWYKYTESLKLIKYGRIVLDLDKSTGKTENLFDNFNKMSKEAFVVKDEIEKEFKSLLLDDYREIPDLVSSR